MKVTFSKPLEALFLSYKGGFRILLGFRSSERILVTECVNHNAVQSKNQQETKNNILSFFPAGVQVVGFLTPSFDQKLDLDYLIDHDEIVLVCNGNNSLSFLIQSLSDGNQNCETTAPNFVSSVDVLGEIFSNYFVVNVKSAHLCRFIKNRDLKTGFMNALNKVYEEIDTPDLRFIVKDEKPILFSPGSEKVAEELCQTKFNLKKFSQKKAIFAPEISDLYTSESIQVDPYVKNCTDGSIPIIKVVETSGTVIKISLKIDAYAFCSKDLKSSEMCKILKYSMLQQINNVKFCLEKLLNSAKISTPQTLNFLSPSAVLFNITYCAEMSDAESKDFRQDYLHSFFMTSTEKPLYTRLNSIALPATPVSYLVNTHIGLKNPDSETGQLHLVHGCYSYHHYMQDRVDDNGWGCAYRSLQTIVSWFRHQGYTEKSVPTHREIQEILVTIGDKPKKFVGSRLWIGSIEVSNVLNDYLNVTSKIMSLSRGSEMESRGRELAYHFDTVGTPIMIGGGVLAHTIIGVCFSEATGETQFLILDPHYTGTEDLKTIQSKGWCGWKGNDFWNKNAFYNLCLPQKPDCF